MIPYVMKWIQRVGGLGLRLFCGLFLRDIVVSAFLATRECLLCRDQDADYTLSLEVENGTTFLKFV